MKFDELYKKVIDSCKAFEERQVPISLDFKIEDLRDALVESNDTIEKLKDKCQMHDFFWEGCGFAKRGFKNTIAVSEAFDKLEAENERLKKKLENVQASMYADVVDANMEVRRLKRALYKACANWARSERYTEATWHGDEHREELWAEVQDKCLKKVEEYK